MKITAIIAEYNPLHKGHVYHLEASKAQTDADYMVVVLSGNFTQRGTPAVMDKYVRTKMALLSGADLVLELPLPYGVGSGEYFAQGAVSLLDKLGVVDCLSFGSEGGDLPLLQKTASLLVEEPLSYRQALQEALSAGNSFPAAQEIALSCLLEKTKAKEVTAPNNKLGMEYLKALAKRKSSISPFTIKREGSGYHEDALPEGIGNFCSASALRTYFAENKSLEGISAFVPTNLLSLYEAHWEKSFPLSANDFSLPLFYQLLSLPKDSYTQYWDVSKSLADRIGKNLLHFTDYDGFCQLLKTKNMTYTRISRCLLHLLLQLTQEQIDTYASWDYVPYARILGFQKKATPLLHHIKEHSSIPLIAKLADGPSKLDAKYLPMLQQEIAASHLYEGIKAQKFHTPIQEETRREIIIL